MFWKFGTLVQGLQVSNKKKQPKTQVCCWIFQSSRRLSEMRSFSHTQAAAALLPGRCAWFLVLLAKGYYDEALWKLRYGRLRSILMLEIEAFPSNSVTCVLFLVFCEAFRWVPGSNVKRASLFGELGQGRAAIRHAGHCPGELINLNLMVGQLFVKCLFCFICSFTLSLARRNFIRMIYKQKKCEPFKRRISNSWPVAKRHRQTFFKKKLLVHVVQT